MKPFFAFGILFFLLIGACTPDPVKTEFNQLLSSPSLAALDSFSAKYDQSAYQKQVDSLREDLLYAKLLKKQPRIFDLENHLKQFPNSPHLNEIQALEKGFPLLKNFNTDSMVGYTLLGYAKSNRDTQLISLNFQPFKGFKNDTSKKQSVCTINTSQISQKVEVAFEKQTQTLLFMNPLKGELNQNKILVGRGRFYYDSLKQETSIESIDPSQYWQFILKNHKL
jgi:hypothetical protein